MARRILAILAIILGASSSIAYLYYAPSRLSLAIADPSPMPYSDNITGIYITLSAIEIHSASAGEDGGWQTLSKHVTLNLMTVLSTSKVLDTTQLSPGAYTELRFFTGQAIITVNGINATYVIPSGNQTGIKAPVTGGGFHIYGGETMTIQLNLSFNNNEIMNNPNKMLTPTATATIT